MKRERSKRVSLDEIALKERITGLELQRNELAAVLKQIAGADAPNFSEAFAKCVDLARAALAKLEAK